MIARKEKNKFCREELTSDLKFLGSEFVMVDKDNIIVPVPERSRILDSIMYFRDSNKITAKIFQEIQDSTVLHEIFRLARIQSALVNAFFDKEFRQILLTLRSTSQQKLGFGDEEILVGIDQLEKEVNVVCSKLKKPHERYLCVFFFLAPQSSAE